MEARLHDSVDEFRAVAEPLYRRDPIAHTIELTLLRANRFPDDSLLLTVWDDDVPLGAALQTPPYPLVCNAIPTAAMSVVAAELARLRPELVGVRGARDTAVAFAQAWHSITGHPGTVTTEERLYRLGTLRHPDAVAGRPREADDDDRGLLVDWVGQFFGETFDHPREPSAGDRFVRTAHEIGDRFTLWVVDGTPVSMAMLRAPAAGVSRIGPVFTPGDCRGHGYGSAVTAAASEVARRNRVKDVVLFADLANPVSNAIYRRIGFEPVVDQARIDFAAAG
jgi:GNAT superfamily N-acetyltransferase